MFTVGELSRLTGVTVRALHHYDEIGLVVPSARSDAGYRLYHQDDVTRLQQVLVPERFRDAAGRETGLMVVGLAAGAPAESAGVMPGDIILEVDGQRTGRSRGLSAALAPERIGQPATLKLLRAGEVRLISVTIGTRPAKA